MPTVWHPQVTLIKISGPRRGECCFCHPTWSSMMGNFRLEEEIARMKKNQERRLHRKNAKIVKEGGTPMQLNRPLKPDTTVRCRLLLKEKKKKHQCLVLQRRCGHCGQMGHMSAYPLSFFFHPSRDSSCAETNRKCPRWAEFNSGTGPATPMPSGSATSPPPSGLPTLGFNRGPAGAAFGFPAAVPSPLATSPPMSAMEDEGVPSTPSIANPKIKLTLKRT